MTRDAEEKRVVSFYEKFGCRVWRTSHAGNQRRSKVTAGIPDLIIFWKLPRKQKRLGH